MKREELAHVLRSAAEISGDARMLVVGSQAILAGLAEDELPEEVTLSMEADIAFLDGDVDKADRVEGAIGEDSFFHRQFGYYAQGVDLTTATLPDGWADRAISFTHGDHGAAEAICPEIHDLVASKLLAGREKDIAYARALLAAGLLDPGVLAQRVEALPILEGPRRRTVAMVERLDRTDT